MSERSRGHYAGVAESLDLWQQAERLIPGGAQLISRRPSRFAYGISPIYADRAVGARFWDVDGNEYIDWVSGIGAVILGYADPVVDEAVMRQLRSGTLTSINHRLEIELAECLIEAIPCAEMVRYCKGGGEACAIAVRIARGVTDRDKILFCGYHGWHDWYLAANLGAENSLDAHLFSGIEPIGVPRCLEGTAIPFPHGESEHLRRLLDLHAGEVAAIIIEPLRSEMPPAGYLNEVAELARSHGVVLIFDEVSTGLRPSAGGVQPAVNVVPDMAVFAKSISNGYPLGVVAGRREVMEPAARMFISSTYWSDTLGLQAALTTMGEVRRRDVPAQLSGLGRALKDGLNAAASEAGLPVRCVGIDFHPRLETDATALDAALAPKLMTLFTQETAKRGCHVAGSFYLNAAQGDAELSETIDAAREAFAVIARGLQSGKLDELLECEPSRDSFRRLVR